MNKDSKNSILGFNGEYRFLSNFISSIVTLDGVEYPTVEHAYQAAKTLDISEREKIKNLSKAYEVKKVGKKIKTRKDWNEIKINIMYSLVKEKFSRYKDLKESLLATGDAYIEESNSWGDIFWGVCNGEGRNELGKILMKVREELSNKT